MILTIAGVLNTDEVRQTVDDLKQVIWRDGAETAGAVARVVKRNEQADLSSRAGVRIRDLVSSAVRSHPVVEAFARPARWTRLLVSRSRNNGGYGLHVDNPFIIADGEPVRTDLSYTLFLSDPEAYDGGELAIEAAGVTHRVKGQPGDLVIYPSTTLHQVEPVTSGERLVAVGWIQSRIRSGEQRELLFDLENLKAELGRTHDPNSVEMLTLSKSMANLKRMWMD